MSDLPDRLEAAAEWSMHQASPMPDWDALLKEAAAALRKARQRAMACRFVVVETVATNAFFDDSWVGRVFGPYGKRSAETKRQSLQNDADATVVFEVIEVTA